MKFLSVILKAITTIILAFTALFVVLASFYPEKKKGLKDEKDPW